MPWPATTQPSSLQRLQQHIDAHLWCLQMTLVLKVPPPTAQWHSRPLWRPHVSGPQSLPHVVVLAAPAPKVDPVAVHALKLLPGEDGDASKEILHNAHSLLGASGSPHELLPQQSSTPCAQLKGGSASPAPHDGLRRCQCRQHCEADQHAAALHAAMPRVPACTGLSSSSPLKQGSGASGAPTLPSTF